MAIELACGHVIDDAWCPDCTTHRDGAATVLARMEALGRAGLTVSVCCGPCGTAPFRWTVQVLSREGEEFQRPFAANDFSHAIEIAELESQQRGWLTSQLGRE